MSASSQLWSPSPATLCNPAIEAAQPNWYAVHTRSRHERIVSQRLQEKGISTYLPIVNEVHHWSDRRKVVQIPLFSCYLFVRIPPVNESRLEVLRIDSVLGFVGVRGQGTAIPDAQIDSVRTLVEENLPMHAYPFLKIGQRVRIRSGALCGVEGILVSRNGDDTLIISIEAIQRSLAVRIQGYDVEPV